MTENASPFAWQPTVEIKRRAQLTKFIEFCGAQSFDELYRRSIENVAWFTETLLKFLDVRFEPPYAQILDTSRGVEWSRWCVGGGLNIAARCVDYHLDKPTARQPAVIWEGETGATRTLTYRELAHEIERCAAGLRAHGLKKGDAVGIHLPMTPETVAALIALARIGAIAVPVFSGYGATAIETRMKDVEAKALITCDWFPRRGARVEAKKTADEAVARCASIEKVFVVSHADENTKATDDETKTSETEAKTVRDVAWSQLLADGAQLISKDANAARIEPTSAEDLLLIIYTSGTTGRPKGIQHTHCGFPVKAAQDMCFGTDVGEGTRICWLTDLGWMMGPWLIYGALILGGTITLYDGAPDYPNADRVWEFCARHKVEILGVSPSLIRALATRGDDLPKRHDLSALRMFASTGEPWNPDPWRWLFEKVGDCQIPIINYSGGTEISGGILMGNPLLPEKPCAFPAPCPGIAADIVDENGDSVSPDTVGELVIRKPWIGMARGFWRDPERYLETYWRRFPNVWVHGDWASFDQDGQWYIHGRSDDTLKIAGKRVGPAEVESILVAHESVIEAAAIGIPDEMKGTALIAFCILAPDAEASDELAETLRESVGRELGKPLRPSRVHFVKALPRTRNAKVMRRVIRAAYLNEDAGDTTALENPLAVEEIRRAAG